MTLKHLEEYRDSAIAKKLIERIKNTINHDVRLMEVCGTHTVSIFRSGIRSILPPHDFTAVGAGLSGLRHRSKRNRRVYRTGPNR